MAQRLELAIPETTDRNDLYRNEWKRVQVLASMFWSRWRKEYLPQLQQRKKWTDSQRFESYKYLGVYILLVFR
jgi:hypothetical protein